MVKILAINLGSTSTKIAYYNGQEISIRKTFYHDKEETLKFKTSLEQKEFRKQAILDFVEENNYNLENVDVFVGRGGLIKPVEGGTYLVNEQMIADLESLKYGDHVCNLGAILAKEFADVYNKVAYTVNPVVVDELDDIARVSGFKGIERKSVFHALNHKAVGHRYAKSINKSYEELNLVVAHLGGGISVGLHRHGKVVDVNEALGGEGPFSPARAGSLPVFGVMDYCLNNKHLPADEVKRMLVRKGGLYSYLNTSSGMEIVERINNGDQEASFYLQAMVYQIIKNIGALYFINKGQIDAVIFTGGLINQELIQKSLKTYLPESLTVVYYPGEDELEALIEGVFRVINNEEQLKHYK